MAPAPLREVVARHGLAPRKKLGQHFLFDRNLIGRIVGAAGPLEHCDVLEVGPGPGGLTEALLVAGARRVIAVERDERCLAALAELAARYPRRLDVVAADALTVDEAALFPAPAKIVANLPYNVATPLLLKWCRTPERWLGLTLMFQKEVAERLLAPPRRKDYGRLTVMVSWRFAAKRAFDVPAAAFVPPPKVTSTVVALTPLPAAAVAPADHDALEAVVRAAFGQRRKMLRSSLKSLGVDTQRLLAETGIDPTARAEELTVVSFAGLARGYRAQAR
jgi:16S rRNA (adenine1518-N6/adenine1519-N6)-dimethyltransferase